MAICRIKNEVKLEIKHSKFLFKFISTFVRISLFAIPKKYSEFKRINLVMHSDILKYKELYNM